MTTRASHMWLNRGLVLLGRGSAGLLPLVVFGWVSRQSGLTALGEFASVYMLAQSVAEIADFVAQRHVSRLVASGLVGDALQTRLAGFNALRLSTLGLTLVLALVANRVGLGSGDVWLDLAILALAPWVFATNTYYAAALALNRYLLIGLGPSVCLVVTTILMLVLPQVSLLSGVWAVVVSIHAAKACETLLLGVRLPHPALTSRREWALREWIQTRFLFFQGALSAANARLIVPLLSVAGGAQAAGLLSIGLSVLAITSLFSVAITLPAYREVLNLEPPDSPVAAWRLAKRDWVTGAWIGLVVTVGLCVLVAWPLAPVLGVTGRETRLAVSLIVLGGVFESLNLFGGALYHACHQDRRLFRLSVVTMCLNWIGAITGVKAGAAVGMAGGLLASRAVGALVLYFPILVARRRSGWV